MDHWEIDFWCCSKLTLMLSKSSSRPPSMMIMPSPAFMEFVSESNRRDKADWKSLACLPSWRGGSLSEGWVAASPAVFESLSTWWGMMGAPINGIKHVNTESCKTVLPSNEVEIHSFDIFSFNIDRSWNRSQVANQIATSLEISFLGSVLIRSGIYVDQSEYWISF